MKTLCGGLDGVLLFVDPCKESAIEDEKQRRGTSSFSTHSSSPAAAAAFVGRSIFRTAPPQEFELNSGSVWKAFVLS